MKYRPRRWWILYTASLSQNISVDPSIGTPNIINLSLIAVTSSTTFFNAVNSDSKVDDSTEFYLLLNQIIGARLKNISIPVCESLVTLSAAWLASTKQCRVIILPLGFGISSGIAPWNRDKSLPSQTCGNGLRWWVAILGRSTASSSALASSGQICDIQPVGVRLLANQGVRK